MNARLTVSAICVLALASLAAAEMPTLDDLMLVWMHEPGVKIVPLSDGRIGLDAAFEDSHQQNLKRYRALTLPVPPHWLRQYAEKDEYLWSYEQFQGVDAFGREWYYAGSAGNKSLARYVEKGRLASVNLGRAIFAREGPAGDWPRRGRHVLCDADGRVWILGVNALYEFRDGNTTAVKFPSLGDPQANASFVANEHNAPCWKESLCSVSGSVWVVRQCVGNYEWLGSFLVRCSGGRAAVVAAVRDQFIEGVVHHDGALYLLLATRKDDVTTPSSVMRLGLKEGKVIAADRLKSLIADLAADDFNTRQRATDELRGIAQSQIVELEEALKAPKSIEQRIRLEGILSAISEGSLGKPEKTRLGGLSAARLMLIDRQGRQYVRGAGDDANSARRLLVVDANSLRQVPLPGDDFSVDCQGDDGLIYCHDAARLYAMDPASLKLTALARWGMVPPGPITARRKGLICVAVPVPVPYGASTAQAWFDLSKPAEAPVLPGRKISDEIMRSDGRNACPVALGPGGRLWFVRHRNVPIKDRGPDFQLPEATVTSQLCRADGGTVKELSDWQPTSVGPTVWPLGKDAAIVATEAGSEGIEGVLFYAAGQSHRSSNLMTLLEEKHQALRELMRDGDLFICGFGNWGRSACLMRLGDTFYVEAQTYERADAGSGMVENSALHRDGEWLDRRKQVLGDYSGYLPIIPRLYAADPDTGRALLMADDSRTLRWRKVSSTGKEGEDIVAKSGPWAFCWPNRTALPRHSGAWMLTPEAADHFLKVSPEREAQCKRRGSKLTFMDTEYEDGDMPAVQRFVNGRFQVLKQTLVGTAPWDLENAGLWLARMREVEVVFPDGRRQLIALDAAKGEFVRIARESDSAVWVATLHSLWRFRLETGGEGKPWWQADRRCRLPRVGSDFAGPWLAGEDLYFICEGGLFHTTIKELLAQAAALPATPVTSLPPL